MPLRPRLGFILACIFLDALGIGLIVPVLPRLIGVLSETRDAQTWWYGLIMLSYGLMQFVSAPLLGALSDRIGRRPVLLAGILGLALTFAVPAFFASLPLILASRVVGGFMSANITVAQAYIADITPTHERAANFGKIGAIFGVGFVLGPGLGGLLGQYDPRLPFAIATVLALMNFLYGALVLPESLTDREKRPLTLRAYNPLSVIYHLIQGQRNGTYVMMLALTGLGNALLQVSWALYTEFRYGFTPLYIGLSVFALGISISSVQGLFLPRAILNFPSQTVVTGALVTGVLSLLGIALTGNGWIASLCFCTYAVSGAVGPIITSAISQEASMNAQGSTMGAVSALNSLTGAIGPLLSTPLLMFANAHHDDFLVGAPYFICALLFFTALLIYFFRRPTYLPFDDEGQD